MKTIAPVLRELSARSTQAAWDYFFDTSILPSHILRSEGFAGSSVAGLYSLYDEMEEKDGHLFAVLQTRKNGVLSCPRKVVPASNASRDQEIAAFITRALGRISGFDQSLFNMLDALGKGLSVQEILWEAREGAVLAICLKSRAPGRFLFGDDGSLRLNVYSVPPADEREDPSQAGAGQTGFSRALFGRPLPHRKFVRFAFGGLYDNPYGRGLCSRAYWYYFLKKNNLRYWSIYNEKFGTPTALGRYGAGATEEDQQRLQEALENLQAETGVALPETVSVELLEAQRSGQASTYRDLAEWCNDEISKIVLGATLTASEGRRSGSLALGKVHERVRGEYIESDARALENAVNSQLIRWLVDFNFGPDAEAPRWIIDTTRDDAFERDIALDRDLLAAGVALPQRYFYEKYQRPMPIHGEPALRYDDQNLFGYHMKHGVLTINEARQRLGLPPVAWGEQRTLVGEGLPGGAEDGRNTAGPEAMKQEGKEAQTEQEKAVREE